MRLKRFHTTWMGRTASAQRWLAAFAHHWLAAFAHHWLAAFAHHYNYQRPNQALNDRTPVAVVTNC